MNGPRGWQPWFGAAQPAADAAAAVLPPAGLQPAVFLDKDGTLVVDVPFNVDPARLVFTPRALPALQRLAASGYALVVVTNQSGLATGRFTRAAWTQLQRALEARLWDEAGVRLTGFYACPHAPGRTLAPACLCRKPAPGLLRQAAARHGLDLARSWMVGDILDDVEAGHRAGCRSVLLDVGNETVWRRSPLRLPEHRALDLADAAAHIVAAGGGTAWTPQSAAAGRCAAGSAA